MTGPVSIGLVAIVLASQPLTIRGHVAHITDGDTLVMRDVDGMDHKIRLHEIDAPELSQGVYGQKSRAALTRLLHDDFVVVIVHGTDRYGRLLGEIKTNGHRETVNRTLVKRGLAHVWYESRNATLHSDQRLAQKNRRGLWSQENVVTPWDYRRQRRNAVGHSTIDVNLIRGLYKQRG